MSKHYSNDLKDLLIKLRIEGNSYKKISEDLKIPISSVHDIYQMYLKRGKVCRKIGSGRKLSLNNNEILKIKKIVEKTPKISAKEIKNKIKSSVSNRTIRNTLHKLSIHSRVAVKKPLLNSIHKKSRLDWALKNLTRKEEEWEQVIWSDESRFKLFGSDGKKRVWCAANQRLNERCMNQTVKFGGGSLMVWGCFSARGMGKLVFVNKNLKTDDYIAILGDSLISSAEIMGMRDFIFQQDNATCHVSKKTLKFFEVNDIKIMEWPAQSPDLNPIENIWAFIKRNLDKMQIKNLQELKEKIQQIWDNIPSCMVKKLIKGMKNRCLSVIKSNGGSIPY